MHRCRMSWSLQLAVSWISRAMAQGCLHMSLSSKQLVITCLVLHNGQNAINFKKTCFSRLHSSQTLASLRSLPISSRLTSVDPTTLKYYDTHTMHPNIQRLCTSHQCASCSTTDPQPAHVPWATSTCAAPPSTLPFAPFLAYCLAAAATWPAWPVMGQGRPHSAKRVYTAILTLSTALSTLSSAGLATISKACSRGKE